MGTTIGRTPHTARSLVDRCIVESSVGPDDGRPSLGKGRTSTRQPGFWKSRASIVTVTYVPSPARLRACAAAPASGWMRTAAQATNTIMTSSPWSLMHRVRLPDRQCERGG